MKKIKLILIAGLTVVTMLLGVLFIAGAMDNSRTEAKSPVLTPQWFEYTGPAENQPGYDPMNPENYTEVSSPSPSCDGANQICAVHTEGQPSSSNPSQTVPSLSELTLLQTDIENKNTDNEQIKFRD